jgi:hypothetical protein
LICAPDLFDLVVVSFSSGGYRAAALGELSWGMAGRKIRV